MKRFLIFLFLFSFTALFAGTKVDLCERRPLPELKNHASCMMEQCKWELAAASLQKLIRWYPGTPDAIYSHYLLGDCYWHLRDYDLANRAFSRYLEEDNSGRCFEKVVCYKFAIAEAFRKGECCHLFGARNLPKWLSADCEALEIYDEIIAIVPGQELAVRSLWGKGCILLKDCRYNESREAYQSLIMAFPRNPLAIESYLMIAKSYLFESRKEPNNSDLLSHAMINIKKFKQAFPGESRIKIAEKMYCQMEEFFAGSIYEIAKFYERTCEPQAAIIYYRSIVKNYPTTCYGKAASREIERMKD